MNKKIKYNKQLIYETTILTIILIISIFIVIKQIQAPKLKKLTTDEIVLENLMNDDEYKLMKTESMLNFEQVLSEESKKIYPDGIPTNNQL